MEIVKLLIASLDFAMLIQSLFFVTGSERHLIAPNFLISELEEKMS